MTFVHGMGRLGVIEIGCIAFLLSLILVPLVRLVAKRFNILDVPDGKIKKHAVATPYLGGLAIYCLIIPIIFFLWENILPKFTISLIIGCTILLVVGLIDDIFVLKPGFKFLGQCLAVACFLIGGWYVHLSIIGIILSAVWLLIIINAFNLIDVMDGLATLVAFCSIMGFMAIEYYLYFQYANNFVFDMLLLCAGSAGVFAGFFVYNKPQASIYLGDAGSLLMGGLLGIVSLHIEFCQLPSFGYLAPVIVLAVPLLEITVLILIRTYKRIPFYKASPDHFSILLQNHGWSKNKILVYIAIMMLVTNITSYKIITGHINPLTTAIIAVIFLFIWFNFLVYGSLWVRKKLS